MNDALNKFKAEMEKRGLFRKITAVSYTHLDVYKRQMLNHLYCQFGMTP